MKYFHQSSSTSIATKSAGMPSTINSSFSFLFNYSRLQFHKKFLTFKQKISSDDFVVCQYEIDLHALKP